MLKDNGLDNSIRLGILIALCYLGGYVTFVPIKKATGLLKCTFRKHLKALRDKGLITYGKAVTPLGVRAVARITDKGSS
ncbi:helix-turn-helix transcriptional regulator [Pyrobaculum aerophilum]|uniref:Transcriptional regulator n=1 Tax=Pyrobaculum aerophilum TaxID=13773 RepID=A0A371R001_9CREN|nr:helix-turn-helix transcriptional regulator [Pyrobaculum aerophilum]RFA96153.1 transcriptional regulator [Pyrobaculum aerophilum]RFA96303.1 transcriptional regulator [Pyrobaculum aerophilum]